MGGAFDYEKAVQCSRALFYYSLGLSVVALVRVLVQSFYALKDTRTPVFVALIVFVFNFLFSLLLMGPLKHGGLALASTLSAFCQLALLLWLLRRKIGPFGGRGIALAGGKALLASLPMAVVVYWVMGRVNWSLAGHKLYNGMVVGGAVAGGMLVYFLFAHLCRCEEAHEAVRLFQRKVLKR
jgi:putative peptidoglycan lipid II flippase